MERRSQSEKGKFNQSLNISRLARLFRRRRLVFILYLLFILSMTAPSVVAQGSKTTATIAQVQPGKNSYESGNFVQAARELQAAVANFAAKGDKLSQAVALRNLSLVYQQMGQWQDAEGAIAQSLSLLQTQPKNNTQLKFLAQALDVQARLYRETGRGADAVETWQKATNIYQQINDTIGIDQSRINQASALQYLGFYPRACNILREVLGLSASSTPELKRQQCNISESEFKTLKALPVTAINVWGLRSLGDVLHALGELEQAKIVLQQSLEAAQKLQLGAEIAATQLSLGNNAIALAVKNSPQPNLRSQFIQAALTAYQAAENTPSPFGQIQARLNQLSLLVETGKTAAALTLWQSQKSAVMRLPPTRAGVYAQVNFARSLLKLAKINVNPDYRAIEEILTAALERAKALGDAKFQAYVLASWGRLYELQQQWIPAANITNQGLRLVQPLTAPDIAYQLFWQLGRINKAQGDVENAIAHYSQATKILSSLRSDLVTINPDVQFSFRESVEPVYRELVSLLLQPNANQENIKQARQTIESLQLAELDNFFQDACAIAKPKQIDEIDPTAAVFYPIILSDRLEVILSLPNQPLRHYATIKSQSELEQTFIDTRTSLRRTAFDQERLPLAQKIYDWLIRPAESDLIQNNIKTLVFVLDGALRNLPMAALYDGQQYLVQKYNIALTPGLQLLEPRRLTREQLRALTAALSEARQGFPPLPATATEVQQISAEVPARVLLNQQFTRPNLQQLIRAVPYPVLHLATHGQFSSNADDTFILSWDDRINVKQLDGLLRVRELGQRPIELLVLSACETAAGDNRAALGLAGIAIRSGARSTVATLWQVNDESTAIFMAEFYKQLANKGVNKAAALRKAQLALLSQSQYQNPYFWAPFVLVGNWQ